MNILFRTDAGREIGTGHVMRCLALAQVACDAGNKTLFASANITTSLRKEISKGKHPQISLTETAYGKEEAIETANCAKELGAQWIVLDGYNFGAEYQHVLKELGMHVLIIDDYKHSTHYYADLILNQNASADPKLYSNKEKYTKMLLGPRYALLRLMFRRWREWERKIPDRAKRLLVTLGGTDINNATGMIMQALAPLSNKLEQVYIIGGSNQHLDELQKAAEELKVTAAVDVTDMPKYMAEADFSISAGGTTCYEIAFMGLPVMTIVTADNQEQIAEALAKEGVSLNLGWYNTISSQVLQNKVERLAEDKGQRMAMSQRGRKLVDGEGAVRVLSKMSEMLR